MASAPLSASALRACRSCGLVMRIDGLAPCAGARCPRCRAVTRFAGAERARSRAAAFALAALILYPVAMSLPVLEIQQMGRVNSSTIWSGVVSLFNDGHALLALIVFLCSIVIPLLKIGGILVLSVRPRALARHHQAATHRIIDIIGKWGMVDVLLVATLVAAVKLGDWVDVHPGPGALAFAAVVLLSLLSSACFDPSHLWEDRA